MYDVDDEESMDDPISLAYEGFPEDGVQKSSRIYEIEDDVEDDLISLIINPNEKYIDTDIVDLRSSDEENEKPNPIPKSGYGNKNFIIPVTFLDFYRNVKLLKKCKPLSIKVVDCDKHPWYYGHRIASKPTVNVNCLTLGKHSIVIKQEIKEEKTEEDAVTLENEEVKIETSANSSQSLNDKAQEERKVKSLVNSATSIPTLLNDKAQKERNVKSLVNSATSIPTLLNDKAQEERNVKSLVNSATPIPTLNHNYVKLENEPENPKKSEDLSQVDFKRNSGLVGLTISTKDLDSNLDKVTKKKTPKTRKEENIVNDKVMQGIGVKLNNLGTSVIPVAEKKDDNVLDDVTKDRQAPEITLHKLSSNSNKNIDKIHNNAISPTRCSLKITSSKILEKIIQLKKAKSQDASKPKPPQKPKKILDKDHTVPKLNLKRKSPTKEADFYIGNSNKEPRSNYSSVKPQEPQKDQNAVENKIHKKKSAETSQIIPSVTITLRNQETFTPHKLMIAEKLDQTQSRAALTTPKSHSKKLKLNKKSILKNDSNKIIQNEPIMSMCPNNQDANASNSSLTSGLNEVLVSNVQSLRNMTTLNSNRPTRKKTEIDVSRPEHFNFKGTKNDAAKSNFNVNKNNENVIRNGDTTTCGTKVKKTGVPSISYLQLYNTYALNCYNSLKELSRKTKTTQPDKNKSDSEILKETKTMNATEQNQINFPKNIVIVPNNNRNVTNYDVQNRDTATGNINLNNAAIPPKTALNIQRFNDQKQFNEYLYMKQNQFNTQPNPTHTVNNFLASKTQVYCLPGNNTVILRKPPPHMQTGTNRTTGLPIETVVNHRPTNIPKPSTGSFSPWSFPPPNTNVACNVPYHSMSNMNICTENQMNPQHYWQVTKSINPYLPPPSSVVQQEINSNLILVKNQVSDDSIIGSTANGELIKKINIGVPPSDTTVVSDKQKMLDTLNNAIKEQNDFITKICDPRSTSQASRGKPCPLSKKAKIDPEPNIDPSKGYSPPILPIPSFQKAIELVKMKQKVHNLILSQAEKMGNVEAGTNSIGKKHGHRSVHKRKTPPTETKKHDKTKKISLEEYKKRVSNDGVDANKKPKHKCKRKKVSKNIIVDNNQDLGYDSDATMKL
ncbi:uncharacterized protein [Choristoneura fumiferana]|uniref:uncharacterized protein n=1 Tax=Choristoneura fumiferana TaxID=7141 RepID=UPI003D159065